MNSECEEKPDPATLQTLEALGREDLTETYLRLCRESDFIGLAEFHQNLAKIAEARAAEYAVRMYSKFNIGIKGGIE